MILRAARSSRALATDLLSLLAAGAGGSRSSSTSMTKAKTVPEHPQADDLQERWLQLAFKVKRSEFSRRASAMVRAAKQFHGCPGECQRPSGLAVVCLGAASCSERHATRVVAWEPGCSGRLLAIFWRKNPPEITRFPWSRPAALVVACGRASRAGSLGTQLARSCAGANTGTMFIAHRCMH